MDRPLFDISTVPEVPKVKKTRGQRQKELLDAGYHPTGHPLGPQGRTCGDCALSVQVNGGRRNYWKCKFVGITHGEATDIRISWPACSHWRSGERA